MNANEPTLETGITDCPIAQVRHFSSAHSFLAQGVSNAEDGDDFRKRLDIRVNSMDDEIMEFDLVGVSPSFANALRRILLSEVTTMAIEHVFFLNNTSTIPVRRALAF